MSCGLAVGQLDNKHDMVKSSKEYQWSICTFPGLYSCPQKWLLISWASASWENRLLEHESSKVGLAALAGVLWCVFHAPGLFPLGQDTLWHFLWCGLAVGCGGCWHWDMGLEMPCSSWKICSCMGWLNVAENLHSQPASYSGKQGRSVRMDSLFSKVSGNKPCTGVTALLSFLSSDQRCQS